MYGLSFWKDALERAIKTAFQLVLGAYGVDAVGGGVVIGGWDWQAIGNLMLSGFVMSLITSVASSPIGTKDGTASIVK